MATSFRRLDAAAVWILRDEIKQGPIYGRAVGLAGSIICAEVALTRLGSVSKVANGRRRSSAPVQLQEPSHMISCSHLGL